MYPLSPSPPPPPTHTAGTSDETMAGGGGTEQRLPSSAGLPRRRPPHCHPLLPSLGVLPAHLALSPQELLQT